MVHVLLVRTVTMVYVHYRYEEVPSPHGGRTTTETVLREAMQALGRVQAHMLARIRAVQGKHYWCGSSSTARGVHVYHWY
jgi:hypothetical protein